MIEHKIPFIEFFLHLQDVGLYFCGAKNEMNGDGDKVDGVVYLNMDPGMFK